jgi:hypothetical protein
MLSVGGLLVSLSGIAMAQDAVKIAPATMRRLGTIDERFQSYNIEMVEVTGGRFWKPYASATENKAAPSTANQPAGMDPNLYEYRPPIDLSNTRLRKLAAALGPAYVRVSGTWANTTYFAPDADAAPEKPPSGFNGVLTGKEWRGVVDFSRAVNAELVSSFATSAGTRDAAGVWTPAEAEKVLAFTKQAGGHIAAAEFMNEPTFAQMGGAPKGYDAAAFGKDIAVFRKYIRQAAPGMLLLGPGGVGEGTRLVPASMQMVSTESILSVTGPVFDVFSYHSYGGVSSRCGQMGAGGTTTADAALSDEWLGRSDAIEQFYAALRNRFEPGKPLWNTETAQTACGGDRWASTFLDSFRYLDQLGDLARRGVQVHMYNTLAASDYGLLDEKTYEPRPNYWAALLWRQLMGTTVLVEATGPASGAAAATQQGLRLYAHCLRPHHGGVAVLAINTDKASPRTLDLPMAAEHFTLTAKELTAKIVQLNGVDLELGPNDSLPALTGILVKPGHLVLPPASITFLTFARAENASCR